MVRDIHAPHHRGFRVGDLVRFKKGRGPTKVLMLIVAKFRCDS